MKTADIRAHVQRHGGLQGAAAALARQPCRIAYVGNSVTVQRHGYRPLLHQKLAAHFNQPHVPVNAGFGATGSMGSLYTLPELVLRHRPTLCFIECTTGDMGINAAPETIGPVVEGMVRRLRASNCAIVILHLFHRDRSNHTTDPIICAYESIAAHYGIPTVNVGSYVEQTLTDDEIQLLCIDGIHLSLAGAQQVADLIAGAVFDLAGLPEKTAGLPLPRHANHYEHAGWEPASIRMLDVPSQSNPGRFRGFYDFIEFGPGNWLTFCTDQGPTDGFLMIIGPNTGILALEIGGSRSEITIWDPWCSYDRIQAVLLPRPVPAAVPFKVTMLDKPVPDAVHAANAPKLARIVGILIHRGCPKNGESILDNEQAQ